MKGEFLENLAKRPVRWADLMLIFACVLLIILPYVRMPKSEGAIVEIYRERTKIAEFPLSEAAEYRYVNRGMENVVVIRDGKAFVEEATCPDGLCTHFAPIFRDGETIVCVPSGLRVVIRGGTENDVDGVTGEVGR